MQQNSLNFLVIIWVDKEANWFCHVHDSSWFLTFVCLSRSMKECDWCVLFIQRGLTWGLHIRWLWRCAERTWRRVRWWESYSPLRTGQTETTAGKHERNQREETHWSEEDSRDAPHTPQSRWMKDRARCLLCKLCWWTLGNDPDWVSPSTRGTRQTTPSPTR